MLKHAPFSRQTEVRVCVGGRSRSSLVGSCEKMVDVVSGNFAALLPRIEECIRECDFVGNYAYSHTYTHTQERTKIIMRVPP